MAEKTENFRISNKDKITLIGNLATMLTAGISIVEAIDSLLEDATGKPKKILKYVKSDLVQGKQLHISFARFPKVFDKVTINIIKASEEAGTLDVTLRDIKVHIRKEMEFTDKVRSAMIYPLLIFVVFIGVILLLLIFVIPKMAQVFKKMKAELPLPTKILITLSDGLTSYPLQIIAVLGLIVGLVVVIYMKKREALFKILFSLPLISRLVKEMDLTRFTRSMALLLGSGLTITSALKLSKDVVMRRDIYRLIEHSEHQILSGKKFSEGLRAGKGLVPSIMIKIIEAGEQTGTLDSSLQDMSDQLDYQVTRTLETLTTMLEPIMLILIGIVVGGMMLSIIAPIYGLIGQVGQY